MQKKGEKLGTAKKKDGLGRGKGGAALLSPPLGSLLPSRFTPFFASPPPHYRALASSNINAALTVRLFFLFPCAPVISANIRWYIVLSLRFSDASNCLSRLSSPRIV